MKYSSLRTQRVHPRTWPVAAPADRGVGHVRAAALAEAAAGYFYLNRGWRRSRHLFSHVRLGWTPSGWSVGVWYVDRRPGRPARVGRPRRRRRRVARPGWVAHRGRLTYLNGVGPAWSRTGAAWVWHRLPALFAGNLDTLVAHLAYRLRGRLESRVKAVALPVLRLTQRMPGVAGAHVRCHGRFTRRQRTDRAVHKWGTLGRTHLGSRLEDARLTLVLRFGTVGVTVLVNYGPDPR